MRTAIWLAVGLGAARLCAQSFDERHARDLATNPRDLHFRLSTPSGPFRVGERIPIVLEFSADAPDKYKLDAGGYDRSGRLFCEEFVTGSGTMVGIIGGIRGMPVLSREPTRIDLDLNDWFAFDRPGSYRLYLKSHRLTRERAPGEAGEYRTVGFAAVSNILTVEIAPADPDWEARKLREIREVLDRPAPTPPNLPSDHLRAAWRDLRFLGTPAAVRLSLGDARKPERSLDTFLLVGARDRADMLRAFDEYLADPAAELRGWDIRLRGFFRWISTDAVKPLPFNRHPLPDRAELDKLWATAEMRRKRFDEIVRAEAIRLIPVVRRKQEDVREGSAQAIATHAPEEARAAGLIPPDDYGLSREELIAGFAGFPEKR